MAKKHKHEDHVNHEAWAIPYGDLVTLLLALFVVMYAVSSVNEGKFRQAAASMKAAFTGAPTSMSPIQVGDQSVSGSPPLTAAALAAPPVAPAAGGAGAGGATTGADGGHDIEVMAHEIEQAMGDLIKEGLVVVRNSKAGLEVEIQTDILFASGTSTLSPAAIVILQRLAKVLGHFDQAIQVEGHTDTMPIHTAEFNSNWELSAARAASVVHLFIKDSIRPERLSLTGLGEYHPESSNDTATGRNRNRRVVLVIPADKALVKAVGGAPEPVEKTTPVAASAVLPVPPKVMSDTSQDHGKAR